MVSRIIPLACLVAIAAPASAQEPRTLASELIAADRAFSNAGAKANIVDSISAMMTENAVMPTPKLDFAIGKSAIVEALKSNPANAAASAEWSPIRAGISADGTQGFTYGFMFIHDAGKPDRRAKYLAYWVKRPEGWRVAFYKRAGSADGDITTRVDPALPAEMVAPDPQRLQDNLVSLKAAEQAFSDRAQEIGVGPAFVEFGSEDAMNMGGGSDFTFGNTAIAKAAGEGNAAPITWGPDKGALVATSGDLGVTWGFIRAKEPKAGEPAAFPFFTVWRKAAPDQPWRYVAE
jgi:ketosteroid isomerase-like protein